MQMNQRIKAKSAQTIVLPLIYFNMYF